MGQHFVFVTNGLKDNVQEIEWAMFERYGVFTKHLGIEPTFLCVYYDLDFPKKLNKLKENRVVDKNFNYVNLYDFFLRDCDRLPRIKPEIERVEATSVLVNRNKKRCVKTYNLETKLLEFVSFYYGNGVRYRIDRYDEQGFLSMSVNFTPDGTKKQFINHYRQDGSLAISWQYAEINNENRVHHIVVFDKFGIPCKSFTNEDELHRYLICYYLNSFSHKDQVNLIVDRNIKLFEFSKGNEIRAKVKCFHMMNGIHFEVANDKNSKVNVAFSYLNNLKEFDGVITLTDKQSQDIIDRFGDYNNVNYIPVCKGLNERKDFSLCKQNTVLVFGDLHSQQQFKRMFVIFYNVAKKIPNVQFRLLGQTKFADVLKQQISQLKLQKNVYLCDLDVENSVEFEKAQCSLLVSDYVNHPSKILESLSYGCPIISGDICYGPASMIENGKNGFLLPLNAEEQFISHIIKILKDRSLAQQLSVNAYQTAEKFSPENIAPLWANFVKKITA